MNSAISEASNIYFDTNALIRFIERRDETQEKLRLTLELGVAGDKTMFTSDIAVAECLYGAYKTRDEHLEARYGEFFYGSKLLTLAPVSSRQIIQAARIGADRRMRLVDAVHFLAAFECGCQVFITNDLRLRSERGPEVVHFQNL